VVKVRAFGPKNQDGAFNFHVSRFFDPEKEAFLSNAAGRAGLLVLQLLPNNRW